MCFHFQVNGKFCCLYKCQIQTELLTQECTLVLLFTWTHQLIAEFIKDYEPVRLNVFDSTNSCFVNVSFWDFISSHYKNGRSQY